MTLNDLKETTGWVTFNYMDGSQYTFETTLNPELLGSFTDVISKPGHLFNINTGQWVELPAASQASATLTDVKPQQNEVNEFASKFIR